MARLGWMKKNAKLWSETKNIFRHKSQINCYIYRKINYNKETRTVCKAMQILCFVVLFFKLFSTNFVLLDLLFTLWRSLLVFAPYVTYFIYFILYFLWKFFYHFTLFISKLVKMFFYESKHLSIGVIKSYLQQSPDKQEKTGCILKLFPFEKYRCLLTIYI